MKKLLRIAGILCLASGLHAQHLMQIDDGSGNSILLVPPSGITGSHMLTLPTPPNISMSAGFIATGSVTGQFATWDNSLMAWMPVNPVPALNAMLPDQTGNSGRVLYTDGANVGWTEISAGGAISVFGRSGIVIPQNGDYTFSQISGTTSANQVPNIQDLNGLLDIPHGGTGKTTATDALNALLPNQSGKSYQYLQTDGINTNWATVAAGGVTSTFGRTGDVLAQLGDYNFNQISGVIDPNQLPMIQSMDGVLSLDHGGTGQITANASLNALLPSQPGNSGKYLQSDGVNTSWVNIPQATVLSVFGRTGAIVAALNDYSFAQIAGTASASQIPNLENLNGILDIAHGGTGQISAVAGLNALLPNQSGNNGKVLQSDGVNVSWVNQTAITVTSVFGRTGSVVAAIGDYNFSQILGTANASQIPSLSSLNGILDLAHGGTGQTTANAALNALLPLQSGNALKFLQSDGTSAQWVAISGAPVQSVFGRTGNIIASLNDYSFSQISGVAAASQLPTLQNLNGLLDIGHGGTGQSSADAALNSLLPLQTGNANRILQTSGSSTHWADLPAAVISSVFGRTGAVTAQTADYNFNQISGIAAASQLPNLEALNGMLDIAHGGTGKSSASAAINALLPSQAGKSNAVLQTDGSNVGWVTSVAGGVSSVFGRSGNVVALDSDYTFSMIAGTVSAGQLPMLQNMNGVVDLSHGGTGQTSVSASLNALLPPQAGKANSTLQTDGTTVNWVSISAAPVTSVFGRTGVITAQNNDYSFSMITGSAVASQLPNLQNLNGVLDIAHGGTGQTSAGGILNAILPAQATNATKFLQTDGSNVSWAALPAAPITSVFGRTGAVVASTNDYSFSQISGSATAAQIPNLQSMNGVLDASRGGTGSNTSSATTGSILYMNSGVWVALPPASNTNVLTLSGSVPVWAAANVGTVTSVDAMGVSGITVTGGPITSSGTLSVGIAANGIALDRVVQAAANSLLGNSLASTGNITSLSATQVRSILALSNVENTALSTWAGTSNVTTLGSVTTGTWNGTPISPVKGGTGISTYVLGDLLYSNGANTLGVLAGNSSTTKKFLSQTGSGSASASPSWSVIAAADMPVMVGSGASHASGSVPDPGSTSGTTKFLREDGSWQVPAGGSGGGVNYDVTSAQATATTSTDYLFDVSYSASASSANAAGAVINSVAIGASNSGTGLSVTADGGNSSTDKGIVVTAGNSSATNVSSSGIIITANATGTGLAKGLDVTCVGGANRVGLLLTDGHLQSKQTTTITAVKQAGAGSTATITSTSGCTDVAGKLQINTKGTGKAQGAQVKVTFNKPYATAPIVVVTAGATATFGNGTYVSSVTTTDFTISFFTAPGDGEDQTFYYHVIETQ